MPKAKKIKIKRPDMTKRDEETCLNKDSSVSNHPSQTRKKSWGSRSYEQNVHNQTKIRYANADFFHDKNRSPSSSNENKLRKSPDSRWKPYSTKHQDLKPFNSVKNNSRLKSNVPRQRPNNSNVSAGYSKKENTKSSYHEKSSPPRNDVMEMEVDEVEVVKVVRKNFKTNPSHPGLGRGIFPEIKLEHNRKPDHGRVFIILDTCAIIGKHNLSAIEELFDTNFQGCGYPYVIVPWIVIQELDFLKQNNLKKQTGNTRLNAVAAINFIYARLTGDHPRLLGQNFKMAQESRKHMNIQCNDDQILCCCIHYQKMYKNDLFILLTNDKNLSSKAIISDIRCSATKTIKEEVSKFGRMKFSENFANDWFKKPSKSPSHTQPRSPKIEASFNSPKLKNIDTIICEMKELLNSMVTAIIEYECKKAYGEKLWTKMLPIKQPWDIKSSLRVFNKLWFPVFSFIFNKSDQELYVAMERYFKQSYDGNIKHVSQVLCDASSALKSIKHLDETKEYSKKLSKTLNSLQTLSKDCDRLSAPKLTYQETEPQQTLESKNTSTSHTSKTCKIENFYDDIEMESANIQVDQNVFTNFSPEKDDVNKHDINSLFRKDYTSKKSYSRDSANIEFHQSQSRESGSSAELQSELNIIKTFSNKIEGTHFSHQCDQQSPQLPPSYASQHLVNRDEVFDDLPIIQHEVESCFETVWKEINRYCGMILDGLQISNNWDYLKPDIMPTPQEVYKFLPKFYPAIQKLRKSMKTIVENEVTDESCFKFHHYLCNFFRNADMATPQQLDNLSARKIIAYCQNVSLRSKLTVGLDRLREYQATLQKCVIQLSDLINSSGNNF